MLQKTPNQIIDEILLMKKNKNDSKEMTEKELNTMKSVINGVAQTEYGKYLLKAILKYIEWGKSKKSLDGRVLLIQNGKESVYLDLIRPFLSEENRKDIE